MPPDPSDPISAQRGAHDRNAPRRAAPSTRALKSAAALVAAAALGGVMGWTAHGRFGAAPAIESTAGSAPIHRDGDTGPPAGRGRADGPGDDAAVRFWSELAWSLAARSQGLEGLLEEMQNEAGDPRAALDQAIASSSDQELATIVAAITRIDEDDLLTNGDLRPFASRLVDVALDGLDGPSVEPPPDEQVFFTATTRDFDPGQMAQTAFPSDQGRIFAMIELGQHDGGRVMVKWLNTETRRIHSLQTMTHETGRPLWSYLSKSGTWDPGRYEVSFYTQDAQMRLLGRGAFVVVDREDRT